MDVLADHLAVIDAGEAEVHAFNLVTTEEARAQAEDVDGKVVGRRGPGTPGRRARGPQGQPLYPGGAHHMFVAHPGGMAPPL